MSELTRREFAGNVGAAGLSASAVISGASPAFSSSLVSPRVVIVGGGAGGVTVARRLRRMAPNVDVTLVEVNPLYSSAFLSEHFLGGFRSLESLTHGYDGLRAIGVKVVHDRATGVDAGKRTVNLLGGATLDYDKLVLSPGVQVRVDSIEGYARDAAERMPHAWQSGAQNLALRNQLLDMKDGGVVVMSIPQGVIRGGTAPYARASMIAHYLKYHKPRSKLILLDGNRAFPQRPVFEKAWREKFGSLLEHRLSATLNEFGVTRVDTNTLELETGGGERISGDVVNVVPEQRAGTIASAAGCAEGQWCPVDPATFESQKVKDIHILGDAVETDVMPKTAFLASSQGSVVANHLASELAGKKRFPPRFRNTQWSLIATNHAIKLGANYIVRKGQWVEASSFSSDVNESAAVRTQNFEDSLSWYQSLTRDLFDAA